MLPANNNVEEAMVFLRNILNDIIDRVLTQIQDRDFLRIVIQSGVLETPISIPFVRRDNWDINRLMARIEDIVQSAKEWLLRGNFTITVYHVAMPQGGSNNCFTPRDRHIALELEAWLQKKKSVVIVNNKSDNLCMARSIVIAKAKLENSPNYKAIRRPDQGVGLRIGRMTLQKRLALDLHDSCNIPYDKECNLDDADRFQEVLARDGIQLMIFSLDHGYSFIYKGTPGQRKLYILYYSVDGKGHFGALLNMQGFWNYGYYCEYCEAPYTSSHRHHCKNTCKNCQRQPVCNHNTEPRQCAECYKTFRNNDCFQAHKDNSTCRNIVKCNKCQAHYTRFEKKGKPRKHVCNTYFCRVCCEYKDKGHLCYMRRLQNDDKFQTEVYDNEDEVDTEEAIEESGEEGKVKYIFFDIETVLVEKEHIPYLIVSQKVCNLCLGVEANQNQCTNCGQRQKVFKGENCLEEFCLWLFTAEHKHYTVFGHNAGAFDFLFLLHYLNGQRLCPNMVTRGSRLLYMYVPNFCIKFLDSFNFMHSRLDRLPDMLSLGINHKSFFPYKSLTKEYTTYHGPKLPCSFYYPDSMTNEKRIEFYDWYNELPENYVFDWQDTLESYCINDVSILRHACLKFRNLMICHANLDPFDKSVTLSSFANRVFRTLYLKEGTIGIVPQHNYQRQMNTSHKCISWLEYESQRLGLPIRHSGTAGGEVRILNISCDGYSRDPEVLYFHMGCMWHACPSCYIDRYSHHPYHKHLTMGEVYEQTMKRIQPLFDAGYPVKVLWEHEWDAKYSDDDHFRDFVDNLDLDRYKFIYPRDSLYGGRTEIFKTLHNCEIDKGEKIRYIDVISLYPFVLRDSVFPKGHPRIYHCTKEKLGTNIDKYFGIVRLKVLAPSQLFIPVLPYRSKTGKLIFGLCRACMELQQSEKCMHDNDERGWVGTYTTIELQEALKQNYTIVTIYEVWDYDKTTKYNPETKKHGLFSEYITNFYKLKCKSSGFPKQLQSESEKDKYLNDLLEFDGVKLDKSEISDDIGVRTIAKYLCNSLWGYFGMNANKSQMKYIKDPAEFYGMIRSPKYNITDLFICNAELIRVTYEQSEQMTPPSGKTNVIIA